MAKKSESGFATVGAVGGLLLVGFVGLKYGPAILKRLGVSGSTGTGGGGSTLNRVTYPNQPTKPGQGSGGRSSGSGSGAGSNNGNGPYKSSSGASSVESISQALQRGDYTGASQSVLAGIFNIQQGAGDLAGDSRDSMAQSWLDSGMGLDSLLTGYTIGGGDESLATLNLTGVDLGNGDTYYGGDTSGDNSWVNDLFGFSESDYGPYVASGDTSVDYSGASDYGPTSGGYSYGDAGGGDYSGAGGGGVSDYGPIDPSYGGGGGGGGGEDNGNNGDFSMDDN